MKSADQELHAIVIMVNDSPIYAVAYDPKIDPWKYRRMVDKEILKQERVQRSKFRERFGRLPRRVNEPDYTTLGHVWSMTVKLELDKSLLLVTKSTKSKAQQP